VEQRLPQEGNACGRFGNTLFIGMTVIDLERFDDMEEVEIDR
jgi:hypothetical protein